MGKKRRGAERRAGASVPPAPSAAERGQSPGVPSSGRSLRVLGAALLLVAAALATWRLLPRRAEVKRESGLDVLLISIDTLRADALGCYGQPRGPSPWIDRLAKDAVRFEQAHAHNVMTFPSHANILSGRYPLEHGVRDNSGFRFPANIDTLATLLKRAGYATGAFVSAFSLDSRFDLTRGFDVYDDRYGDPEGRGAFRTPERAGHDTVAAALEWLKARSGPRFAFVHLYEPHHPYDPPEPFRSRFRDDRYHGEVAAADAALEPLLRPILEQGRAGRTLVVLTADHGEALGDHGERSHGLLAYEATLRVPLLLYAPRLLEPRVVADSVRHVDVLPTVLDALGLPLPAGLTGRSLLPLAAGLDAAREPSYFEALSAARNRGWAPLHGLLRFPLKYIDVPIPELYDLAADPRELHNLAASRPAELERMRGQLASLRASDRGMSSAEEESAETRERLRGLGYITAAAPAPQKEHYTEEDDPKRLVALDDQLHEVTARYIDGDLDGALALCREVVARQPRRMSVAQMYMAFLLHAKGDLDGAVAAGERALQASPDNNEAVALLGAHLIDAGRASEAVRLLQPYAARAEPDLDQLLAYGVALARTGRDREALAVFDRVRTIDPSNAMALVNAGTVYLTRRDYARARASLEAAMALDPGIARAHNSLGVVAAETGKVGEAIEHWKRAVQAGPQEWDTLYNLGAVLRREGRSAEARPYLERFAREAPRSLYAADIAKVEGWLRAP